MTPLYKETKKLILEYAKEWEELLGINHITITHRFIESFKTEDDPDTLADTQFYWQYRSGTMRWFLPAIIREDHKGLREDILHEYIHVLVSSMEIELSNKYEKVCEYAVESLSIAIMSLYNKYKKEKG